MAIECISPEKRGGIKQVLKTKNFNQQLASRTDMVIKLEYTNM